MALLRFSRGAPVRYPAYVDQAGSTMSDILDSVRRVSALMDEIARAGQAQSDGIGQIHYAIAQMDNVTHQNASLVEQVAALPCR